MGIVYPTHAMRTARDSVIILAVIFVVFFLVNNRTAPRVREVVRYRSDTVVIRDTLRLPAPNPERIYVVRVDTVLVEIPGDTVRLPAALPVERKEYATSHYRAVVEGFRPELVELTLFPETRTVTNTESRTITRYRRVGFGIQAGYGYNGRRFYPYVGVGVQYNLF